MTLDQNIKSKHIGIKIAGGTVLAITGWMLTPLLTISTAVVRSAGAATYQINKFSVKHPYMTTAVVALALAGGYTHCSGKTALFKESIRNTVQYLHEEKADKAATALLQEQSRRQEVEKGAYVLAQQRDQALEKAAKLEALVYTWQRKPQPMQDLAYCYTIQQGDSLSGVARRYTGDAQLWREIAEYNRLDRPDRLQPNEILRLPSSMVRHANGLVRCD